MMLLLVRACFYLYQRAPRARMTSFVVVEHQLSDFGVGKCRAIGPPDRLGRARLGSVREEIVNGNRLFLRKCRKAKDRKGQKRGPSSGKTHVNLIVTVGTKRKAGRRFLRPIRG